MYNQDSLKALSCLIDWLYLSSKIKWFSIMIGHQPRHHHTCSFMEVVRYLQGMSKIWNGLGHQTKHYRLFFLEVVIRWDT